jgi:tetratricopeptide (TPR) repeat protein
VAPVAAVAVGVAAGAMTTDRRCDAAVRRWRTAVSPATMRPVRVRLLTSASVLALLSGCVTPVWPGVPPAAEGEHAEAARALLDQLDAGRDDVDTIVWFGRRLAYLGALEAAVAVYGEGLRIHGPEPHLLRHRGHRYLSLRDFESARADLGRAATLVEGLPDEIEPDGLPNVRGIPTSTLATNIHYHLGLAHRWLGDDDRAVEAFRACLDRATTVDMEIAARYWLALCLFRVNRPDEARLVAAAVASDADVIENHAYHALCLGISGRRAFADVAGEASAGSPAGTLGYGLAAWAIAEGRFADGVARLREVARTGAPTAFGRIAAEADLARFGDAVR